MNKIKKSIQRRDISGILLLDKPKAISSNHALTKVKHYYRAKKAGHTGSLDPLATGMLPICLGQATKFSQYLLAADKQYSVTAKLGICTSTLDADGQVISESDASYIDSEVIEQILPAFRGDIIQIPPMYSALKYQGQPLYKLARKGIHIERKPRAVHIAALEMLSFAAGELTLRVHCSKGTYIRTLVDDIGKKLGCGAHVTLLRREAVATYQPEKMVTLPVLEELAVMDDLLTLDAYLLPIDSCLSHMPRTELSQAQLTQLQNGQICSFAGQAGITRLYVNNDFWGLGEFQDEGSLVAKCVLRAELSPEKV